MPFGYKKNKKYQDIQSNLNKDSSIYENGFVMPSSTMPPVPSSVIPPSTNTNANLLQALSGSSSSSASTSSSSNSSHLTSSDRALLHRTCVKPHRLNLPYCLLVFAIILIALALISMAITFIFPFWITLHIQNSSSLIGSLNGTPLVELDGYLNITNTDYGLSLLTKNYTGSNESTPREITFDVGLWEVKMNKELEFFDVQLNEIVSENTYPHSMQWLNADVNDFHQSFLVKLLQYIGLKSSFLFLMQILEILQMIFLFLTLVFTSYTLCLCTNHRTSVCWYIGCFLLAAVSFFLGLAVVILLVIWSNTNIPNLSFESQFGDPYHLVKTYSWVFWYVVGLNGIICLASLLVFIYLVISAIAIYHHKDDLKHRRQYMDFNPQIRIHEPIDGPFQTPDQKIYQNAGNFTSIAEVNPIEQYPLRSAAPQASTLVNSELIVSRPSQQLSNQQPIVQMSSYVNEERTTMSGDVVSPSYIFYTGHGNFRKQSVQLDDPRQIENIPTTSTLNNAEFVQQNHLISYTMMMQNNPQNGYQQQQQHQNDHQYSNLPENTAEYKLTYR